MPRKAHAKLRSHQPSERAGCRYDPEGLIGARFLDRLPREKLISSISAQKSHVKPQNHLNRYTAITSIWHFSYLQSAILKQDRKKPRANPGAFSFKSQACTGKSGRRSFLMKTLHKFDGIGD